MYGLKQAEILAYKQLVLVKNLKMMDTNQQTEQLVFGHINLDQQNLHYVSMTSELNILQDTTHYIE